MLKVAWEDIKSSPALFIFEKSVSYSHEDELEALGPFREPEYHENLWIGESLKERG